MIIPKQHLIKLKILYLIVVKLFKMAEYLPHIDVCLGNPSYRVREMAAKASVALIDNEDVTRHFDKCFAKISDPKISDNECHGTLLQVNIKHICCKI